MTTVFLQGGEDSWVERDTPAVNNGNSQSITTGWLLSEVHPASYGPYWHAGYYKPNNNQWSKIPAGAVIDNAHLFLKVSHTKENQNNVPARVFMANGGWSESTINYNNAPSTLGNILSVLNCSPGQWKAFDVEPWVRGARFNNNNLRNYGLTIRPYDAVPSNPYGVNFHSLETPYPPYVRVNFHAQTPSITKVTNPSNVRGLRIEGSGYNGGGTIYVQSSESSNGPWGGIGIANTDALAANEWAISDTSLADAPGAPRVSLSTSGSSITIHWTAASQSPRRTFYRAITQLGDGTYSGWSNTPGPYNYTPPITEYQIDRKIGGGAWQNDIKTTGPAAREFTDTGLSPDVQIQYRVTARNEQGRWGNSGSDSISIVKPSPPTFSSLTVPNQNAFKLEGSGAPSSAIIKIYRSLNGSTYGHIGSITGDSNNEWNIGNPATVIHSPNIPTILFNNKEEGKITLSWNTPGNRSTQQWYKVSRVINGVESELTTAKDALLTPFITRFVIKRKLHTENDSLFTIIRDTNNDSVNTPLPTSIDDRTVNPGGKYVYQVTTYNNHNKTSIATTSTIESPLPAAPTIFSDTVYPKILNKNDGSEYIRIAGAGRKAIGTTLEDVDSIRIERSRDLVTWSVLTPDSSTQIVNPIPVVDGGNEKEQWLRDNQSISVNDPRIPEWNLTSRPVDKDGINLRWKASSNPTSSFHYRAKRIVRNVAGYPSNYVTAIIKPRIISYSIQRRLNPLSVVDTSEVEPSEFDWQLIHVIIPEPGTTTPPTTWTDKVIKDPTSQEVGVRYNRVYDYRIIANNNFGLSSDADSAKVKALSTFDAPDPAPPPPPPTKPIITDGNPRGVINVSGNHPLRLVWNYSHPEEEKQVAYILSATWGDESNPNIRYWDNTENTWRLEEKKNSSSSNFSDVSMSVFEDGIDYTITVQAQSENGGLSDPYSNWIISGAESYTVYYDTRRFITRTYTSNFPLYRKIVNRVEDDRFPSLSVSWIVEPQLPLEVDDTNWEGGGNTWPWTVFDNSGRPEPYAKIDFDKDGKNIASFQCDERGRINLTIPDDIKPGIYTFRQRGPSMAPQTIHDFVIVDPWMIYKHGHRHSAHGPDPIYGITNEQLADNANIHPSQIQGAEALGDIVDSYGSNIKEGLEKHMSSGHGFYVVSGLDYDTNTTNHLLVREGVCWENASLKKIPETRVLFSESGIYKIFVSLGVIRSDKRVAFPTTSTPLYTVTVTNTPTEFDLEAKTVTVDVDERLRHPDSVSVGNVTPVKWGAETTDDILHNNKNLKDLLQLRFSQINERIESEDKIYNEFEDKTDEIIRNVNIYESDNRKAREAMLNIGFTTSMKHLYSYFNRQAAQELLLENSSNLIESGMNDILTYLTNVVNGGLVHHSSHISAFQTGDELSSITNLLIRNSVATLPNNWTRGTQYTLRTLRIEGAPARYLDFHVIYEETNANFRVLGSLNNEGRYVPKQMTKIKTVKDNRLKDTFGTSRNCFIDTYRAIFPLTGTESVVELLVTGGDLPDGVRIRGYSIVTG